MPAVTFTVTIKLGSGDTSIHIFNHLVSYEHYFPESGTWTQILDNGSYLVSLAGTCPPGGTVSVDIDGIASSSKPLPITINSAGPFIKSLTITV